MKEVAGPEPSVVQQLVEHIREERLRAGDRLPSIRELSARLGLGANAIRDGLIQAEALGLVEIRPRSGVYVQASELPPAGGLDDGLEAALGGSEPNYFHLMDVRRLIEVEAAGLTAARCRPEDLLPLTQAMRAMESSGDDLDQLIEGDDRFHLGIAGITGNPVFGTVLRVLLLLLRPCRRELVPTPEIRVRTDRQHREIYRMLRLGDVEGARDAMRDHLSAHYQSLLNEVEAVAAVPEPAS